MSFLNFINVESMSALDEREGRPCPCLFGCVLLLTSIHLQNWWLRFCFGLQFHGFRFPNWWDSVWLGLSEAQSQNWTALVLFNTFLSKVTRRRAGFTISKCWPFQGERSNEVQRPVVLRQARTWLSSPLINWQFPFSVPVSYGDLRMRVTPTSHRNSSRAAATSLSSHGGKIVVRKWIPH
jgi:hypothetical protein